MNIEKEELKELCISGLKTDGAHHKQWYLEEILKKLGFELKKVSREIVEAEAVEENEDPGKYADNYCYDAYIWEDGIPP